ncbi:hypothetical protein HPB48_009941 [Haemaphysalis longicornis]|uniref:HSF-type DNA-binding domain-containing protein n=1 Tax=Haemaphysalis longicornis TaxID=44386 RepID=A0A9J6GNN7_HAELO|nr:hypothetical protein HPB48_009941 [Haemaphysalis longicornis]
MDSSDAPEKSLLPSSSFHNWTFPKKLWKIVNECKSGAIAWSKDGTAVIINYPKFHSDYLEKHNGVFRTNSIASFLRQLNVYGFRRVHPRVSMLAYKLGSPDSHVYRHEFFVRGKPDMLSKVVRKTTRRWRRKKDGGELGSSSGGSRVELPNIGHGTPPRQEPIPVRRAQDQQLRGAEPARVGTPASRPTDTAVNAAGTPSEMTGTTNNGAHSDRTPVIRLQDSPSDTETSDTETSDTDTSDDEYDYSLYVDARRELRNAMARSSASAGGDGGMVDYDASDVYVDGWVQPAAAGSKSPAESLGRSTGALQLYPSLLPSGGLMFHEREDERHLAPPIEDVGMMHHEVRPIGESTDDELCETPP